MSSTHGNLKHTIKPYILYNKMSPNCTYSNMSLSSPSPIPFIDQDRSMSNISDTPDTPEQDVKLLGHLGHLGYGHFGYRHPYWSHLGYRYGGYYGMPYYGCNSYRNCWRWPWYY